MQAESPLRCKVLKTDMSSYLTVKDRSSAEYVEKRSKFIAYTAPCETEAQAMEFLAEIRTKHWDARHNCFAFVVEKGSLSRFSDDGEPHGTAGKPILEVITGSGLVNVAVVVTRYFGGVLLGTGGLVRAYTKATKEALDNAPKAEMMLCTEFEITCEYSDHGTLQKLLEDNHAEISDTNFTDKVKVTYLLKTKQADVFNQKLTEVFSGRITPLEKNQIIAPFSVIE